MLSYSLMAYEPLPLETIYEEDGEEIPVDPILSHLFWFLSVEELVLFYGRMLLILSVAGDSPRNHKMRLLLNQELVRRTGMPYHQFVRNKGVITQP